MLYSDALIAKKKERKKVKTFLECFWKMVNLPSRYFCLFVYSFLQEPDALIRNCSIVSNLSSQLFFPVEHIAWLAENKIIGIVPDKWWSRGIMLWAISLTMNIIK